MTTKKQRERKERKRKAQREERVKRRRTAIREKHKEEKEQARLEDKFRLRVAPIRNTPQTQIQQEAAAIDRHQPKASVPLSAMFHQKQITDQQLSNDKLILERLKHNQEILKAIEQAMEQEEAERKVLQDQLDAEGHNTLKEKMNAISVRAEEALGVDNSELHEALDKSEG